MLAGSVNDISPISNCLTLEHLHLSGGTIDNLDFIDPLAIKCLTLENFRSTLKCLLVPNLSTLDTLKIHKVAKITDLSFLSEFTQLKDIDLFELHSKQLPDFSKLNLNRLNITNMFHLKDFSTLTSLRQLESLIIKYFFINRKMNFDVKAALAEVIGHLTNVQSIKLDINGEKLDKPQLIGNVY